MKGNCKVLPNISSWMNQVFEQIAWICHHLQLKNKPVSQMHRLKFNPHTQKQYYCIVLYKLYCCMIFLVVKKNLLSNLFILL